MFNHAPIFTRMPVIGHFDNSTGFIVLIFFNFSTYLISTSITKRIFPYFLTKRYCVNWRAGFMSILPAPRAVPHKAKISTDICYAKIKISG